MNRGSPWKAMILLATGTLFAMSLWFSASAVVPVLSKIWNLSESTAAWLTLSVQLGFVFGTLLSAILNLSDIINARHLLTLCAITAAMCNALLAWFANGAGSAIGLRFLTGMFLAGVYPPAMKIMASWFRSGRGMAIGVLIGALTFGKATPYLINAFQMNNWRNTLIISSALTIFGAITILLFLKDGPYAQPGARFDWTQVGKVFSNRSVRLANFGYLGHMWELYAMWTWTPVMIRASFAAHHVKPEIAETISFLAIAAGALGCIIAGVLADRYGRTLVASTAMVISGACCLFVGFLFDQSPIWLAIITFVWGISVVADSAQFSASVTELADQRYIGTALTLQTCLGFLLTVITIKLIPIFAANFGWRYAFWLLAPGPFLGVLAMLRLRKLPEALRIAQGKR
ncbi:MAG TPA: MFS transporter [Acidobacteriota bacterium]|nr:MFS transporter [Acidobacteriota bacterium]